MYQVTTIEKWRNHITESTYNFSNIFERNKFINMCKEDGVYIIVHKNKIAM